MRPWPDSTFGRLFLAACLAIGAMLAVSLLLVAQDRRALALRVGGTQDTIDQVVRLTRELAALGPEPRRAAIERLDVRPAEWRAPRSGDRDGGPPLPMASSPADAARNARRVYVEPLRRLLGPGYTITARAAEGGSPEPVVDLGRPPRSGSGNGPRSIGGGGAPGRGGPPGGGIGFSFGPRDLYELTVVDPNGVRLLFWVAATREEPWIDARLGGQVGLLTLVLGLVLYATTRHLTRPLARLQAAAEQVGRSAQVPHLDATGPREVRETLQAFNTMQDRLRRYVDSRTRVLAAMSHDLRTPLTRLRLRAETVDDEALRQRFIDDIEQMDVLVERALGLFKGLNQDEPAAPVDLDALLRTLQQEFAELGRELPIERTTTGGPLELRPMSLKRALTNLVENGFKYGGRVRLVVEDGDAVQLRVLDDGPGLPPEELERVFEPFYRAEASRSRDTGGVGLGLSIARDAVEAQGGTLVLHNRAEGGLEALLTLPRQRGGAAQRCQDRRSAANSAREQAVGDVGIVAPFLAEGRCRPVARQEGDVVAEWEEPARGSSASSCAWSPRGKSVRPIEPGEQHVADDREARALGCTNTTCPGVWPGQWCTSQRLRRRPAPRRPRAASVSGVNPSPSAKP